MEKLRFSTAVLRLLGEELNPYPDQGILELVKNAYDADASECTVELLGAHIVGGSIRVRDNGIGMVPEQIRDGWLVVGESTKAGRERSPGGRLLVGSKGLGRLAALRLGGKALLVTRPKEKPEKEYSVSLDWKAFDEAQLVEQVELNIEEHARKRATPSGTEVLVEDLPFAWKPGDVKRLARALLLLTDPFENSGGFRAKLKADEFSEIARRARQGYWSDCDWHLVASVGVDGKAKAQVCNSAGDVVFQADHETVTDDQTKKSYNTPPLTFELWEFLLDRKRFSTKTAKFDDVKNWLSVFGGVYLYHRGVRVAPYGDPGNDWLDMNLSRVRSPELRPSTNNSIGRVTVEDPKALLQQKTDRLGFVDNESFRELIEFACDALDWMARERLRARETRKRSQRKEVEKKRTEAHAEATKVVEKLPRAVRGVVEQAIKRLEDAQSAEIEVLQDEAQLYHTLGTVGTTAAAFAHQTNKPLCLIQTESESLESLLGNPKQPSFPQLSLACVQRIRRASKALLAFADVTLKLLEHEKRRRGRLEVHQSIEDTVGLLKPYFDLMHVIPRYEFEPQKLHIFGSRAAFEAVLTNLISNSLQAFSRGDRQGLESGKQRESDGRLLVFRSRFVNERVRLIIMDNGPGMSNISLDDIWLPGRTTTERGTGLGLAIVKDVISDLGGSIEVVANGEIGGAQFIIELPVRNT